MRLAGVSQRTLDFGCGDGWFARQVLNAGLAEDLVPLDVKRRDKVFVEPQIYPAGAALPFPDRHFDMVYSVDVLHHCPHPVSQLEELSRVAGKYILIKDHTCQGAAGKWMLAVLDELGNRKYGIPSLYQYQEGWAWSETLGRLGWVETKKVHPALCHVGVLGGLTNSLQYVALYERASVLEEAGAELGEAKDSRQPFVKP